MNRLLPSFSRSVARATRSTNVNVNVNSRPLVFQFTRSAGYDFGFPTESETRGGKSRPIPMVSDVMVTINFYNARGELFSLAGKVGQTLSNVVHDHGLNYHLLSDDCIGGRDVEYIRHNEDWNENQFGLGVASNRPHVVIPKEHRHLMEPAAEDELVVLDSLDRNFYKGEVLEDGSRLASEIVITKEMDNMRVLVPEPLPTDYADWH